VQTLIADSFLFHRQFDAVGLSGLLDKHVASEFGTTEITVKTQCAALCESTPRISR